MEDKDLEVQHSKIPTYKKFDKAYADLVNEEGKWIKKNGAKWKKSKLDTHKFYFEANPDYNLKPLNAIQRNIKPEYYFKHDEKAGTNLTQRYGIPREKGGIFQNSQYGMRSSAIADALSNNKLTPKTKNHLAAQAFVHGPNPNVPLQNNHQTGTYETGYGSGWHTGETSSSVSSNNPFEDEITQGGKSKYYDENHSDSLSPYFYTKGGHDANSSHHYHFAVNDDDHWIDDDKPIADLDKGDDKNG